MSTATETQTTAAPARATVNTRNDGKRLILSIRKGKTETPPPVPPSGKGVHQWEWAYASWARDQGLPPQEAARGIMAHSGSLYRRLNDKVVQATVEKVYATSKVEFDPLRDPPPRVCSWDERETARIHREHPATTADLIAASPTAVDALKPRPLLQQLFPNSEGLLCLGRGKYYFYTGPLRGFPDLKTWEFIVAGYMTTQMGETTGKDGKAKLSYHTKDNTGPRRFIVFDFDDPPPEQHASIITHLAKFRPLVMALSTGGKGLHAWFPTTDRPDDDDLFWRLGITLGADSVIHRNPSQFVRLPLGTRSGSKAPQSVCYFNPKVIPQ